MLAGAGPGRGLVVCLILAKRLNELLNCAYISTKSYGLYLGYIQKTGEGVDDGV